MRARGAGVAAAGVALLGACAQGPEAEGPTSAGSRHLAGMDREAARAEAVEVLSGFLSVDTSNPPGNELAGARYLADRLAAEGIEAEVAEFAPGRANLVARLRAEAPTEPPLCLLSHVDVVRAEANAWKEAPFSGKVDADGWIWGRGALDMKGVGVLHLLSMLWLRRLDVPLRRDVVLLAVGDEEVENLGAKALAARWDAIGCSQLLNEGGFGVRDAIVDGVDVLTVSYAEKGSLWLRLWAAGEPGHGSTPLPDSAPVRLMQALDRVRTWAPEPRWTPELHALLADVGRRAGGVSGAVLGSPALTRALAGGRLLAHPLGRASLTNTLNVTGFGGHDSPNVVPSRVFAQLDVRLLPGERSGDVLDELGELVADVPGVELEVLHDLPAFASPLDDRLYEGVVRTLRASFPDAAVGPLLMAGTTDSQVFRPLGVRCYGFAPFLVPVDELRGMHGRDERIHRDVLGRGVEVMLEVVLDAAAAP